MCHRVFPGGGGPLPVKRKRARLGLLHLLLQPNAIGKDRIIEDPYTYLHTYIILLTSPLDIISSFLGQLILVNGNHLMYSHSSELI